MLNKNTLRLFASSYISKARLLVFLIQTNHNSLSILFLKGKNARLVIAKVPWLGTCARAEKSMLVSSFIASCLFFFFETDFLSKPVAQLSVRLSGQWTPGSCLSLPFPSVEVIAHTAMASFAVSAKDLRRPLVP